MNESGQIQAGRTQIASVTVANNLSVQDLRLALAAGWADWRAVPAFGLFFGGIYVVAGLLICFVLFSRGYSGWLVPAAAGFPLLAPFAAVGLYEVSRRREAGLPIRRGAVLGALRGHGDDQIISFGVIVFVAFAFWLMIAHGIFAVFMAGAEGHALGLSMFLSGAGLAMLVLGSLVGAVIALAFYAITVISLPLLVDREVDFITAIIVSLATVRSNARVMLVWAAFIAVALFLAMLPAFLGLFVVLPVLGHATWHLYRRVVA